MSKHELYNRAGDGNRVRTLISILIYVIYFNLFVECFGCLRFFRWQSQPSPWTLVDKCSCSNARFSNSDMRVSSVSSCISMDSELLVNIVFSGVSKVSDVYESLICRVDIIYVN